MNISMKKTDLTSLFEQALQGVSIEQFLEAGVVIQVSDNVCTIYGLTNVMLGERVTFEGGNHGIVLQLEEDSVSVLLLDEAIPVREKEVVSRTNTLFTVPVGSYLLGRVINATGQLIDYDGSDYTIEEERPVEVDIPGIADRTPVNVPLETGIMAVDTLVPIGRGQRELIIGSRGSGKTALAVDTIIHQKGKGVICIYVAIGMRQSNVARLTQQLAVHGALDYTVIVTAHAGEAVINQYLAPYVGCTVAEYFSGQGKDVVVVYDDLSNHAVAFREISLLLRRSPGREAYPGDVFYLHSRLLERAGNFLQSGSITALPIVQLQGDDFSAYIPTNLISITDGQIFLDTELFNQGIRPAVNAELSVSRVGGAAQTKAVKRMTKALRLDLAQYKELLDFAQFGTELDDISKRKLARGERVVALLKQAQYETYSFVDQALMLFLLRNNYLDVLAVKHVHLYGIQFASYIQSVYGNLYQEIQQSEDIAIEIEDRLREVADEFAKLFVAPRDEQ